MFKIGGWETSVKTKIKVAGTDAQGKMISNLFKDFIWHAINIHSKFSCIYHYTVDKFLAVAILPIYIHVIIYILLWHV